MYFPARAKAYTVKNIISAFEKTGIWPFNPRRVLGEVINKKRTETKVVSSSAESAIPETPKTTRQVACLVRYGIGLIDEKDERSKKLQGILEKLGKTGEAVLTDNVLLTDRVHELVGQKQEKKSSQQHLDPEKLAKIYDNEEIIRLLDK